MHFRCCSRRSSGIRAGLATASWAHSRSASWWPALVRFPSGCSSTVSAGAGSCRWARSSPVTLLLVLARTESVLALLCRMDRSGRGHGDAALRTGIRRHLRELRRRCAQGRHGADADGGICQHVFWPLSQGLVHATGWRGAAAILGWANLLLCAPLHVLFLPPSAGAAGRTSAFSPGKRRSPGG